MDLTREFPQDSNLCYLNHAAVAPWPRSAAEAVQRFALENMQRGAQDYPNWIQVENALRSNLARLIHAPSAADIALVKNTSEGLSMIAYGLAWQPGDQVVITDQEFPSNRIVWESLARLGVKTLVAQLDQGESPEAAIAAVITPKTRLISVSSVQFGTGLRLDLARLGALCRQHGVLFCVDAIQSIGAEPLDVQALGIDFTTADGHKWLLGPEGLGLLYVRPEIREQLTLHEFGWHMVKHRGDYSRTDWSPAEDARRFECGSPNLLAAHALKASTDLLLAVGMAQVQTLLQARMQYLYEKLAGIDGFQPITSSDAKRRSGILTCRFNQMDSAKLHQQLMNAQVICANRGGGVRFSPHFYTPFSVLDQAIGRLGAILDRG